MKILMIGDVVGNPGRRILKERLPQIRRDLGVVAVIANAENAAAGSGITVPLANEIFAAGVDAITMGDHTWGQKEFVSTIGQLSNLVRPANYPPAAPKAAGLARADRRASPFCFHRATTARGKICLS